jgi:hypothetical protein
MAQAKDRFLREAQAAAAIEHDHVVTIHQVGEERGVPFLAMQWLKGMSLNDRLHRAEGEHPLGALPVPLVLRLGRQIARGLAAAHDRGLIHRDIKPANLWIEPRDGGRIKILDFGLARALADNVHLTQSGTIIGTPAYMAPEQARGEAVDHRCDLFSLGTVLYRMTTGRLPFRGNSTMAVLTSLAMDTPVAARSVNADVPAELSELIMELLAKDPAARPPTARAVGDRLLALERQIAQPSTAVAQTPVGTHVAPASDGDRKGTKPNRSVALPPARKRPPVLTVAAVGLLVLAPLAWFCGGTIIRFATNQGDLVIEVEDNDVEVRIVRDGLSVVDLTSKREFTLTAGKGEIEVLEKGGGIKLATRQFELIRGGKTTVKVRLGELADARKPKDPVRAAVKNVPTVVASSAQDRRAAEWALKLGTVVIVQQDGQWRHDIMKLEDIPPQPFRVYRINAWGMRQVDDAALANIEALSELQEIELAGTSITDEGLKVLKTLPKLAWLSLHETQIGDAGWSH